MDISRAEGCEVCGAVGGGGESSEGILGGEYVYGLEGNVGLRAGIEEWVGGACLWRFGLVL